MAANLKRRQEEEGMKLSGPDTVIENTPAQIEGMKLSGPDVPTFYPDRPDDYETRTEAQVNFDAPKGGDPNPDRFVNLTKGIGEGQQREDKKPTFTLEELKNISAQYPNSFVDPRSMDTQGFSVPSPAGKNISLEDQLKIINQAYKNNSVELLMVNQKTQLLIMMMLHVKEQNNYS
jgi:hypothetical protein